MTKELPLLKRQSDIEYLNGDILRPPQVGEVWLVQLNKSTGHLAEYKILSFTERTVRVLSPCGTAYNYLRSMIWFIEKVQQASDIDTVSVFNQFYNKV